MQCVHRMLKKMHTYFAENGWSFRLEIASFTNLICIRNCSIISFNDFYCNNSPLVSPLWQDISQPILFYSYTYKIINCLNDWQKYEKSTLKRVKGLLQNISFKCYQKKKKIYITIFKNKIRIKAKFIFKLKN